MIVVEGCDGTGKSTLVRDLMGDLNLKEGQRGTANRDELYKVTREDTYRALAHAVEGYHPPFIWDRLGPISDPIYSRAQERKVAFSLPELEHFKHVVQAIKAPIVLCHIPLEYARENQEKSHQMDAVNENFDFIHNTYEAVRDALQDWGPFVHVYDYRVEGAYFELLEKLRTYVVRRAVREWH